LGTTVDFLVDSASFMASTVLLLAVIRSRDGDFRALRDKLPCCRRAAIRDHAALVDEDTKAEEEPGTVSEAAAPAAAAGDSARTSEPALFHRLNFFLSVAHWCL
jgi:hypothetical protein